MLNYLFGVLVLPKSWDDTKIGNVYLDVDLLLKLWLVLFNAAEDGESEWHFNYDELASKFSDRTKVIMLNTPHNPTGKVFSKAELQFVASLCRLHNVVVIADEVYEFVVYSPHEHVKIATLEGKCLRNRFSNS